MVRIMKGRLMAYSRAERQANIPRALSPAVSCGMAHQRAQLRASVRVELDIWLREEKGAFLSVLGAEEDNTSPPTGNVVNGTARSELPSVMRCVLRNLSTQGVHAWRCLFSRDPAAPPDP